MDDDEIDSLYPCVWHGRPFVTVRHFGGEPEYEPDYTHATMTSEQELRCSRNFYYAVENEAGERKMTSREDSLERLFDLGFYLKRTLHSREQVRNWFGGGKAPAKNVEKTKGGNQKWEVENISGAKRGRSGKAKTSTNDIPEK